MNRKFNFLHVLPVRRVGEGARLLGVFGGLAEHVGFSTKITRVLGFFVLLGLGETLSHVGIAMPVGSILIYVALALMMQPPAAEGYASINGHASSGASRLQPVFPGTTTAAGSHQRPADLVALEQRLESLGRRIAKMENVVVTRERDWDRRLGA